jgi:hypothetical protein
MLALLVDSACIGFINAIGEVVGISIEFTQRLQILVPSSRQRGSRIIKQSRN